MVLALAVMAFWNGAGYYDDSEPRGISDAAWLYGWPATYLTRGVYREPSLLAQRMSWGWQWEPKWSAGFIWSKSKGIAEFEVHSLMLNGSIAVLIALTVGCAFEVWRRRRHHLFQYHLSDLCVAVIVIGGVLAYGRHAALTTAALEKLQQHHFGRYIVVEWRRGTPECVRVLLPGGWRKPGDYAAGIRLSDVVITDEDLNIIGSQKLLRAIELSDIEMKSPHQWERLVSFGQIEELTIRGKPWKPENFALLPHFQNLRQLHLSLDQLSDQDLRYVGQIKTLEELDVYQWSGNEAELEGPELKHLANLPALFKLSLRFDYRYDGPPPRCDLNWVGQCRQLRHLTIDKKRLSRRDMAGLVQLTELEGLTLWGCELEDRRDGEMLLSSCRKLKRLEFGVPLVGTAFWRDHAQSLHLEELRASLDDEKLTSISRLRSLRRLDCISGDVSNAGVTVLYKLPRIEFLKLATDHLDDRAVESIAAIGSLRELDISCCRTITTAGRQKLQRLRPDLKFVGGGPCWQDY